MSSTQEKLPPEHNCHWRAYGQPDGTVVCDECNCAADVNKLIDSAKREAQIKMLRNMKKSLMVARVNPGLKPLQLPEDARIQQMIADEFDRNIAQLEQSKESE